MRYFLSLLMIIIFSIETNVTGQSDALVFFVSQENNTLTLHSIDENLEFRTVFTIPDSFAPLANNSLAIPELSNAFIPTVESIFISPDGENIALSARNDSQDMVYIDEIGGALLGSFEGNMDEVKWSPDSRLFAIYNRDLTILDVREQISTTIPIDGNSFNAFTWLDNYRIITVQGQNEDNLYLVDLSTSQSSQLTDLHSSPEWDFWQSQENATGIGGWDNICAVMWSEPIQRAYFVVGCPNSVDEASLYSVGLEGNMQLELSLPRMYPDATHNGIYSLHPTSDAILVFTQTVSVPDDENREFLNDWRLFKLSDSGSPEMLYETSPSTGVIDATMSPNGNLLAFVEPTDIVESEHIRVLSIASQNLVISPPLDGRFCGMEWLTNHQLIISIADVVCTPSNTQRQLVAYDTNANTFISLDIDTDFVWLLPSQRTRRENLSRRETYWASH